MPIVRVLPGTEKGMEETFGSTCHGAGRACSRNNSRNKLDYQQVSPGPASVLRVLQLRG